MCKKSSPISDVKGTSTPLHHLSCENLNLSTPKFIVKSVNNQRSTDRAKTKQKKKNRYFPSYITTRTSKQDSQFILLNYYIRFESPTNND